MGGIAVERLSVRRGGRPVLRDVSFRVAAGRCALLRGPSGSGKTTLLHVLAGLVPHHDAADVRGRVTVAGFDARTTPPAAQAERVALLGQDAEDQFLGHDVESEVAYRLEARGGPRANLRARVDRTLRAWGLGRLRERPLHALSGGERRRVLLAALTATDPQVLLLDEPLANLDAAWRARVAADLARMAGSVTMVVAEHRFADLLDVVDRVVDLPAPERGTRARLPATAPASPPRPRVAVDVSDLRVEHAPGAATLRNLAFRVVGGLVAVVGDNGAGKTTLARTLAGLRAPAHGTVRLDGVDPAALRPRDRARLVGFVPQRPADMLFAPTVAQDVAAGPHALRGADEAARAADGALRAFDLRRLATRSPFALSGGEAQRTALAAALAHDPPLALLDEPTQGLDGRGRALLEAWLDARRHGGTTLVFTHDARLAARCDRVLALGPGGRLVLDAPTSSREARERLAAMDASMTPVARADPPRRPLVAEAFP